MLDLAIRDAIEHRNVWTGAFLITAVTAMFTACCCHALFLGLLGPDSAFLTPVARDSLLIMSSNLMALSGLPSILVLGLVLNTLVTQTRRTHSLWRLAGSSPQQVVRIFSTQVVLVSACGALVGATASIPTHNAVTSLLGRGTIDVSQTLPEFARYLGILLSVVTVSAWGILAGVLPGIRASRTSPLAGQAPDTEPPSPPRRLTKLLVFVVFLQIPLLVPLIAVPPSGGLIAGLVTILPATQALVITVALLAPYYLTPLIRIWTLIPGLSRWIPWDIARHIATTRVSQSTATVTPLMIGIGLFTNFNMAAAAASNAQGSPINMFDGILMLTPIAAIGAVGSVAVVFMASRHRARDLTSLRVAGASPVASMSVFICEALIYVITAVLIALMQSCIAFLILTASASRWNAPIDLSGLDLTGATVVTLLGGVGTVLIMLLGGLTAWRRPLATYLVNG